MQKSSRSRKGKMNIYKKLTKFAEKQAERRCIDKQIFIWAVICFCDFVRKNGYTLIYTGKPNAKQDIQKSGEKDV